MSDVLMEKLFCDQDRWERAIETAVDKGIDKRELRELSQPAVRVELYRMIRDGKYEMAPPHMALIPKDNGEYRTVFVNESADRVLLSLINDLLFEECGDMVHPSCKSYQKGIGCGKIVQRVSEIIRSYTSTIGWKSDLSKYFDSVPIEFIDGIFDKVEKRCGKSALIDMVRKYYHTDLCFDTDGKLVSQYQSLKQGCAVASFLADAALYHIDDKLSRMNGFYVRYSDDTLFVGPDYAYAMETMKAELAKMKMALNPKKVEYLSSKAWFKFLGFSIKGGEISLSKSRIKDFQKQIDALTFKAGHHSMAKAINAVNRYLYKGNGEHAWATQCLGIINNEHDVQELNKYVMDAIRATVTKRGNLGGLGYNVESCKGGVVDRGRGKSVRSNRNKTDKEIVGYKTLNCMRKALLADREAYNALVLAM